jgi:2-methylisocitrate lyase-like PEP mutase family enzyme
MSSYEIFRALHQKGKPLLLGNAWNVHSARIFEKNGYTAIGTSSAAIAHTLGYEDGEKISFAELFFIVERITANTRLPVSVDMEAGYSSHIPEVITNIEKLHAAGVAGINLEDSVQRQLIPAEEFGKKLEKIKNHLTRNNMRIFINARTDAFLFGMPSALSITLERIKAYENAGADGIFVPALTGEKEIKDITAATALPVNVLCVPGLPSFDSLAEWGVRRISLGSSAFRAIYSHFEQLSKKIIVGRSALPLF